MSSWKIILNPTAGRGRAQKALPELRHLLESSSISYDLSLTQGPGHAIELAREAANSGWERVFAAGGDGTLREVAQGLAGTPSVLGVLPVGTGNDLARSLRIPLKLSEAIPALLNGSVGPLDAGFEGEHIFLSAAGVGFPTQVMEAVNRKKNQVRGPLAFLWGIWETLDRLQPTPLEIWADGQSHHVNAVFAFVMNSRFTGGGLMMAPQARFDDGFLDLIIAGPVSKGDLIRTLPKVYSGRHIGHPQIQTIKAQEIRIQSDPPLTKLFDGDLRGETPLEIKIRPGALRALYPKVDHGE